MDVDLLIQNANLPDGRSGIDVAFSRGIIVAIETGIDASARETIGAAGRLLAPPFADAHFHLDATLSLGRR